MTSGAETVWKALGVLLLYALVFSFLGLLTMIAWNYGIVALAAATGKSFAGIGFWAAVATNIALAILSRVFVSPHGKRAEA